MAATTMYITATDALTSVTAVHEKLLSTEAPGSGSFAWDTGPTWAIVASTPTGIPAAAGSWDSLAAADCTTSLNVTSWSGAGTLSWVYAYLFDSALAEAAQDILGGGWSSNTGTGIKVFTPPETIDLGTGLVTDRYGLGVYVTSDTTGTVALGADTWVKIPWTLGPYHAVSPTDDVTTTGWSSTPLWSRVDDPPDTPDGTVISATAS